MVKYIIPLLFIPHIIFAQGYWQQYAQALQKEQKQLQSQPYVAPFVMEYITSRIALAQELSHKNDAVKSSQDVSQYLSALPQVLSLCFDTKAMEVTKKQILEYTGNETMSPNDVRIIHTELVLSQFLEYSNNTQSEIVPNDSQAIITAFPPFSHLEASVRLSELYESLRYHKKRAEYIKTIASLCNAKSTDYSEYQKDPQLLENLLASLEASLATKPEYTAINPPQEGIPYQIVIPQPLDCTKAIAEIKQKREALRVWDSAAVQQIEDIALAYITPLQQEIAKQQELLVAMKQTPGVVIENEHAFNQFIQHFTVQSNTLVNYAKATALYCQLMQLKEPQTDYTKRFQHIITLASGLERLIQSYGDSCGNMPYDVFKVFEVLKSFVYVDYKKENEIAIRDTLHTLHVIKENIKEAFTAKKENSLNPAFCNLEVAMNIETLEKGVTLFNKQRYAQEALSRYATVLNHTLQQAQSGLYDENVDRIIKLQSAIPVVPEFDVQQIINEYTSQQYLLRKLRADVASLIQRIQSYQKKGITITQSQKAKDLFETIKNLQPLYTVDVGRYKMNQNNIIIIDKQCAAMITRYARKKCI